MSTSDSIMVYITQREGSKPIIVNSIYPISLKTRVSFGTRINEMLREKMLPSFGHVILNGKKVNTGHMLTHNDAGSGAIHIEIHSDFTFYSADQEQNLDTEVNKLVTQVKELFEKNQHLEDQLKIESGYNRILRQEIARYRKWRPGLVTGLFNTTVRVVSKLTGRPCN